MFFLRPYIYSNKLKTPPKYEVDNSIRLNETAAEAYKKEVQEYWKNTKTLISNEHVRVLNEKIKSSPDMRQQRLKFRIILSSIRRFKESLQL